MAIKTEFDLEKDMWDEKIKGYQVAWYSMDYGGSCTDEDFYPPEKINEVIEHVETVKNEGNLTRRRVFVFLNDGEQYELSMRKLTDEQIRKCNKFDGGR